MVKALVQQTFLSLGRKSTGRRKVHTMKAPWLSALASQALGYLRVKFS